jgi:hypothetical protein
MYILVPDYRKRNLDIFVFVPCILIRTDMLMIRNEDLFAVNVSGIINMF